MSRFDYTKIKKLSASKAYEYRELIAEHAAKNCSGIAKDMLLILASGTNDKNKRISEEKSWIV